MKNVHYKILNLQVKQEHNYTKFGKTHCGFERQTFTPQETEKVDRRVPYCKSDQKESEAIPQDGVQ